MSESDQPLIFRCLFINCKQANTVNIAFKLVLKYISAVGK